MQRALGTSRYLRLLQDTIPDRSMFVYNYLKDHLLSLAQEDLPLLLTKRILKGALQGLAEAAPSEHCAYRLGRFLHKPSFLNDNL
jgi:hypothetical protein